MNIWKPRQNKSVTTNWWQLRSSTGSYDQLAGCQICSYDQQGLTVTTIFLKISRCKFSLPAELKHMVIAEIHSVICHMGTAHGQVFLISSIVWSHRFRPSPSWLVVTAVGRNCYSPVDTIYMMFVVLPQPLPSISQSKLFYVSPNWVYLVVFTLDFQMNWHSCGRQTSAWR